MFGKRVIRLGDPTTHGGVVVSATSHLNMFGKHVARIGDKVTCPLPGHGVCTIVEGDPTWTIDGRNVALEGHKTSCGASLISTLPNVARSYEGMGMASGGGAARSVVVAAAQAGGTTTTASAVNEPHALRFRAIDPESGEPLPYRPYEAIRANGAKITGTTDGDGFTDPIQGNDAEQVEIHVAFNAPNRNLERQEVA